MLDSVEMVLRGGAATTFLLLAVMLLRDGRNLTLARLGALFAISAVWSALWIEPFCDWAFRWALPVVLILMGKTAAFFLFSRALFDDGFKMKPVHWGLLGGMVALGAAWILSVKFNLPGYPARIAFQLSEIALAASAAWLAWNGRSADLVEPRRRARIAFVLLSSVFTIVITTSYLAPGRAPPIVGDLNGVGLFIMAMGMALLVVGLRSEEMFAASAAAMDPAKDSPPAVVVCTDPTEARLLSKLQCLMQEERLYRESGLTIGALGASVGAPEYALRRLINGRLGFRNFNAYLNGWRLADAKAALLDPEQRDVPISTIALDAGFSSLGPFNRAFKQAEGMTPSEFKSRSEAPATANPASPNVKSA